MQRELNLKPAGCFYLPVGSDFASDKSFNKLVLTGFVVGENPILKKLDKRFNKNKLESDIVSLKLSSKSENDSLICSTRKNVFSEEGMKAVLDYVKIFVEKTAKKMCSGNIKATPIKSKKGMQCDNCNFFSICSYRGDNPRKIDTELQEDDFIEIMKGKKNGR
jgi:ATP-dependent helicase/DNAse subunit B